jgi:glycosyltransferase involved in cell wall biosynthesis
MSQKPTVLLLIPHLGGGGAERVAAHLARGLDSSKYHVHLALAAQRTSIAETFPDSVQIHDLGARHIRSAAGRILRLVRQLRPNLVLSSMAHLNFLVLSLRPFFPRGTRVLVRQNGSLLGTGIPRFYGTLYRLLYPYADLVLCQTSAMAAQVASHIRRADGLHVVPNPVRIEFIRNTAATTSSRWTGPGPHLLAIGRLAPEKGFDLLLHALAMLQNQFPTAGLTILGDGPDQSALRALSTGLGLSQAVHFAGSVPQPASWFSGATLFVLPSRHEGLPNALLEAAAAGLPIVSTPASGGIVDLLRNQPGAWLTESISAQSISAALQAALSTLAPNQRFPHSWIDTFSMDRSLAAYERIIDQTLAGTQQ